MKKILVFLGSPRQGGNTEALADAFIAGAKENGHSCEKIRLGKKKITPCYACNQCWSKGSPCIHKDDMDEIYPLLASADVFVLASPVYYYDWSSQMKLLLDRFYPLDAKEMTDHRNKESVLLAAAADGSPAAFDGIKASYLACGRYLNWKDRGMVLAHQTWNPGDVASSGDWLNQAKELGKKI